MTNRNSKQQKTNKSKINPLHKPRPKVKAPKLSFDGTRLNAHWYPNITTSLVNIASAVIPLDLSSTSTGSPAAGLYSLGLPTVAVTNNYQEYRYNSAKFRWLPMVAPGVAGAGSRCHVAYFDNPEMISAIAASTSLAVLPMIKGCRNTISWNAWEEKVIPVPLTWRRKWFDVNSTILYNTDTTERSVQGALAFVVESINASENLGQIHLDYDVTVKGLTLSLGT